MGAQNEKNWKLKMIFISKLIVVGAFWFTYYLAPGTFLDCMTTNFNWQICSTEVFSCWKFKVDFKLQIKATVLQKVMGSCREEFYNLSGTAKSSSFFFV